MNILQQFNAVFKREYRAVAKITSSLGGGSWAAETQGGRTIVLNGAASVGQSVFYDKSTNKIISQAPSLSVIDVPV